MVWVTRSVMRMVNRSVIEIMKTLNKYQKDLTGLDALKIVSSNNVKEF